MKPNLVSGNRRENIEKRKNNVFPYWQDKHFTARVYHKLKPKKSINNGNRINRIIYGKSGGCPVRFHAAGISASEMLKNKPYVVIIKDRKGEEQWNRSIKAMKRRD